MKRFVLFLFGIFMCTFAIAEQITINWLNEDQTVNQTTTCTVGGDVILPTSPTKRGYTFQGWIANYTPIEYIESTGIQWIDTGVYWKYDYSLQMNITSINNSGNFAFFGTSNNNGWLQGEVSMFWYDTRLDIGVPNSNTTGTGYRIEDVYYKNTNYILDYNNTGASITNAASGVRKNVSFYNFYSDYISNKPLYLFSVYRSPGAFKLHSARIYDNDILVRDMIPVLDYNGVPCMYDKVTDQFFYNAGTGQFIAGPVL